MFYQASFDGDFNGWKIQDSCATNFMFNECPIQEEHKPTGGNPEYESESESEYLDSESDSEWVTYEIFEVRLKNTLW